MFRTERSYQRLHLRAPYRLEILYSDGAYVHLGRGENLSEGGMLLSYISHLPETDSFPLMIAIPNYPSFRNFNLNKLRSFTTELFPQKIIRLKGKIVRTQKLQESTDVVATYRFGLSFDNPDQTSKNIISEYVDTYVANLIYFQVLFDGINTSEENLEKIRALSKILGYDPNLKISVLRQLLTREYQSLQWL